MRGTAQEKPSPGALDGNVALVAGATRGAGRAIAVELARAGATVYATGRSSRAARSEINRPETPGWQRSEKMLDAFGVSEESWRDATARVPHFCISESPTYVGRAVAALAADPDVMRWTGRVVSSGQLARIYGFTDTDGTQPDCWRYVLEVQDVGGPADDTDYR
jgi:NAD(P)-dependent dehydrogenase (short-subunit alcohol dehydrogenase family)